MFSILATMSAELAALLAAYAQTLAHFIFEARAQAPSPDIYLLYSTNHFQACRYGLEGRFIDPYAPKPVPLRQDILETLARLGPHAEVLGTRDALTKLLERVAAKANGASWLRTQLRERGSLPDVVRAQTEAWASDAVL